VAQPLDGPTGRRRRGPDAPGRSPELSPGPGRPGAEGRQELLRIHEMAERIAGGEEPDFVLMAVAAELRDLLGPQDCRFVWDQPSGKGAWIVPRTEGAPGALYCLLMVSKFRDQGAAAVVERSPIEDIEAALQAVVRTLNQVKVHERLLRVAGARVDRAGVALMYRLCNDEEGLRITDLAERLGVDAPTVTRKVQQLEREGLIVRHDDPGDRRASLLVLTAEGQRTIDRVLTARRAWLTRLLDGWEDRDQRRFGQLLSRFAEALTRDLDATVEIDDTDTQ